MPDESYFWFDKKIKYKFSYDHQKRNGSTDYRKNVYYYKIQL